MFDTDTMKVMCMCPVFDNNRSLFPDLDQDQLEHPDWYLERCRPIIGKDFLITARGLLTQEIRSDLKKSVGFPILPAPGYHSAPRAIGCAECHC